MSTFFKTLVAIAGVVMALGSSSTTAQVNSPCEGSSCSNANADAVGIGVGTAVSNPVSQAQGVGVGGAGGSAAANLSSNITQTFEASKRPIYPAPGLAPSISIPQVFQAPTIPTAAKAIPLTMAYLNTCNPVASGDVDLMEIHERGMSRNTEINFLPHPNYHGLGAAGEEGDRIPVGSVMVGFPEEAARYDCLGILSVSARKKRADRVHMFGAINDAQHFVKNELTGFDNVNLLCAENAVSANIGFNSGGIAGGLSPGLSHLGDNSNSFWSFLGGITGQRANTFPEAQIGVTCLVARTDGETEINISALNRGFGPFLAVSSRNGHVGEKAYGAEKSETNQ